MNRIFSHIQYLLLHHECVVIPSIGAFVVRYHQAHLSADGGTFLPPFREVSFNASIVHDDGLLCSSIARSEDISFEQARAAMAFEVDLMRETLLSAGSLTIPRVGTLTQQGDVIAFEPATVGAIDNMAFAPLLPLDLTPLEVEHKEPAILTVTPMARLRKAAVKTVRYAAVVGALVSVSILASTPLLVKDVHIDRASINLPKVSQPKVVTIDTTASDSTFVQAPCVVEEPQVAISATADDEQDYRCFLVVASWATQRQAERYIAESVDGKDMKILFADGRYRVYIAAAHNLESAYAYRNANPAVTESHPDAWVYTRR